MLLEGKKVAEKILEDSKERAKVLDEKGVQPHLAVILVGEDADSIKYVSIKQKKAREIGIEFSLYHFPSNTEGAEVLETIDFLNKDTGISGIIIQLPLPEKFNTDEIINSVDSKKDVDGLTENSPFNPPGPMAIIRLLEEYKIDLTRKKVTIVGRGRLIGRPLEKLLQNRGVEAATVTLGTEGLIEKIKKSDVLISATGTPNIITEELVNKNMIVVDAASDVNFERVKDKVKSITPPIGGIGPITVALLLHNTVLAAEKQH